MFLSGPNPSREQSPVEELANSISHALALAAMVLGTPWLIINKVRYGSVADVVGASVFASTAMLLYFSSALYHLLPPGGVKRMCRRIEHAAIFLLIAGTYTPFTLGVLRGTRGWLLFGVIWGMAAAGIVLNMMAKRPHPVVATGLYLVMGWLIVLAARPLLSALSAPGLFWLAGGGLFYTLGVVFFATDARLRFGHFIWHLFVMGGTLCHYFAILWYAS
ncbi:PAQR family membrane homeostasis protein TrhA [Oceanimonas baumannii]|uniref:Hemolysin D n=1 Tax=Oceanimonas baumannii TaxID=129578 RepID=A0A235CLJ9_9GAMM|nr:hemolysin III family protein [Oceanimonas baumannii]OYD25309.1 hemolysin D [Oceanimonas baumannii]TDW62393.1 hemolysin III [Oceanimonas baumannii]